MSTQEPVIELSTEESWQRLRSAELGRVVTHVRDTVDIFPVNFVVDGDAVVFRTAEGSKLLELTINEDVLFEADGHNDAEAWSVIVRGHARRLELSAEIEAADALALRPWAPTMKRNYVRIEADEITGRWFPRTEEPDHNQP
ncbi:pyridoxamine 5'-phosphate oxidase family protein [Microbacterium suaedae]|uniref:pyridoxamine 5'-phosphate oxidase family protein n=1 Tax=Microbacterium suaedae TaxID=2067813 RepID=UPI000DA1DF04|nr:pyridoxamine 5'-phosphate oxidase family protein [Microbacterium suaedae]